MKMTWRILAIFIIFTINDGLHVSKSSMMGLALRLRQSENSIESEVVMGEMVNSCICKVNGKIYNLTETGQLFTKRPVSFPETTSVYFYLMGICYPFSYPGGTIDFPVKSGQPRCVDASMCQFTNYGNLKSFKYYQLVTTQDYKNGAIKCQLNKTSGTVQWIYKGVPPLFKSGGLVLTLKCPKQGSLPSLLGVRDIDRRYGDPWKYVNVSHRCCCADACYQKPPPKPTVQPSRYKEEDIGLEIGEYGGGFFLLVCILLIGVVVVNRCNEKQPVIVARNYGTFNPTSLLKCRIIDYNEIKDVIRVGEGSYGVVSKGNWNGTEVALKRFKDHVIEDDIYSFINESTWLSKLAHRHIVQCYGVCNMMPNLCIVTEYMERGSVGSIIHHPTSPRVLTWDERIKWSQDAARGMIYLHKHKPQIIHRDLKSFNLLVDEHDVVKIADFGTIKLVNPKLRAPKTKEMQQNDQNGTAWVGTLRWSAPEVIPKHDEYHLIEYTVKSDVFSFAMTFWELMYNKIPFYEKRWEKDIIDAILGGVRPDLRDCPDGMQILLDSWWHVNPDERPDFTTILRQLQSEALKKSVMSIKPSTI